jgi:hypothetical protein
MDDPFCLWQRMVKEMRDGRDPRPALDLHFLADFDDIVRVFDIFVCQLADVYQTVLMHADIHKRTEMVTLVTMPGRVMPAAGL